MLVMAWPAVSALAGPRIVGRPAVVRAGQLVEVSWTAPACADELELLLVLDGSGREPLRVTESLPGAFGTWLWRVPDLPAVSARLVLRWGSEGREIEGEPGPAFAIACPGGRLNPVTRRGGELWVGRGSAPAVRKGGLSPGARASWPSGRAAPATLPREPLPAALRPLAHGDSPRLAEPGVGSIMVAQAISSVPVPLRE